MLFSRRFRLVRSSCGEICRARISDSVLTANALQIAYQSRIRPSAVLFHSDQGTYYTSKKFAESAASCKGMTPFGIHTILKLLKNLSVGALSHERGLAKHCFAQVQDEELCP